MRRTTIDDALTITKMFFDYWRENEQECSLQRSFTMEPETVFEAITEFLRVGFGFIDENGVVLGHLAHTWFGPNPIAEGVLWYVRPKARGGLLAWRLLKAYDKECKERGAILSYNPLHNFATQKMVGGILQKEGYYTFSVNYVKELNV